MGARFIAESTYNKQDMANMRSLGYNFEFEAEVSGFRYSASANVSHDFADKVEKAKKN